SARAQAIIQQVRHFARQGKPQYAAVRIDELFGDIADFLSLEARRHHVRLRQDLAPNLPPALADALQVQQVILNLVRNAVDAIADSQGPRAIVVSARQDQA
ncbi:hypothetical protein RZS08_64795, partial [Arthrospira platensis SPKY1]|nr:hypothetical protein [Arthrospira platensis SPKY1]